MPQWTTHSLTGGRLWAHGGSPAAPRAAVGIRTMDGRGSTNGARHNRATGSRLLTMRLSILSGRTALRCAAGRTPRGQAEDVRQPRSEFAPVQGACTHTHMRTHTRAFTHTNMRAHAHSTRAYTHAHSTRAYTHSHTHARALTMGSHLGMRITALDCTVLHSVAG